MVEHREGAQVAFDVVRTREPVDRVLLLQPPAQPAHVLPELRVERREPLVEGGDVEGDGRRGHRDLDPQPGPATRPRVRQPSRPLRRAFDPVEADELRTCESELSRHDRGELVLPLGGDERLDPGRRARGEQAMGLAVREEGRDPDELLALERKHGLQPRPGRGRIAPPGEHPRGRGERRDARDGELVPLGAKLLQPGGVVDQLGEHDRLSLRKH